MDRKCAECKHMEMVRDCMTCDNELAFFIAVVNERQTGNCGPSGRYWEPREEEE